MNVTRLQNKFCVRKKSPQTRATVVAVLLAAAAAVGAQPTNLPSGLDFSSFKIVVERNIFNQSRMPHERAPQPTRIPDSFSLVGTMLYADGDVAFFDGSSSEFRKALQVDGIIAGFKVTAITLNSVTLSDGTNQTVLKVSTQMRRDDAGQWSVSAENAVYAGTSVAPRSFSRRTHSNHSTYTSGSGRHNFAPTTGAAVVNGAVNGFSPSGTDEEPPPDSEGNPPENAAPAGGANSALERLMQRRAQQEQRLNQGQ